MGAGRGGRVLGRRVRPLLFALRRRGRPGAGPALVGDALGRARCLPRRAGAAPAHRLAAGGSRRRSRGRPPLLDRGRRRRGTPLVRALARPSARPAPPRRRVLHHERCDQRHLLRFRPRRRPRPVIAARKLGRTYGAKHVVRDLDLEVGRGGFLLLTGPNGSGKTTLLRLITGLLVPTAGELEVDASRERIGFLGHEPLVYRELTAIENLDLYGRRYRVGERRERIGMLLERFGLWDARNERADSFSRGMLQRLALCRTLLHDPDLLVLDEPFSALDDDGAALLDRELVELRPGATFVVSTHDPARIDALATQRLAFA